MQTYGSILPGAATIAKLLSQQAAEARRAPASARQEVRLSQIAQRRLKVVRWHDEHGRNVSRTANHFGYSRVTIHHWLRRYKAGAAALEDKSHRPEHCRQSTWSAELEQEVLKLREQYPRWGKDKLVVLLAREGTVVSTSMVGRILKRLKDTGQLVEALPERRKSRKHTPRPYAIRKPKAYVVREPGDLVEVDTVDLRPLPGVVLKHFTARDIVSRWDVLGLYTRATASIAAQFLDAIIERTPNPVKAIQVDGGSEYKAEFELACKERGIPLYVLPPRSPKLNGCVERGNRTHREEFYEVYDLDWTVAGLRPQLLRWEAIYNTVRPHKSLGYLTPQEYITQWRSGRAGKEVVYSIP
ncbi:MAG: integrase core domain-containing protein [Actinobacteria bacterium]|nr:integrase core domain-containing protein [Actinomycetota bacterium]